jgi:hypothetical protein
VEIVFVTQLPPVRQMQALLIASPAVMIQRMIRGAAFDPHILARPLDFPQIPLFLVIAT